MECTFDRKPLKRKYAVLSCEECNKGVVCCVACVEANDVCLPCAPDWKRSKTENTIEHIVAQVQEHGFYFSPENWEEDCRWTEHQQAINIATIVVKLEMAAIRAEEDKPDRSSRVGEFISGNFITDQAEIVGKFDEWVSRGGLNNNHLRNHLFEKDDKWCGDYKLTFYSKKDVQVA